MKKSDLLKIITEADFHSAIVETIANSDEPEGEEVENAIGDLEYLRDEISRALRLIQHYMS